MAETRTGSAYFFDLHLLCGGYAYFSTFTLWTGEGQHGREVRTPSMVIVAVFERVLADLGLHAMLIETESDYEYWLRKRGWALASEAVARGMMQQFLMRHECLKDSVGSYVDVAIASEGAKSHTVSPGRRRTVLERDEGRCLWCGKSKADGVDLTMHHVRPHSRGGETTIRNMVTLCRACNEEIGDEHVAEFFQIARLPHLADLRLLGGGTSGPDAIRWAMQLSDNLMHTRCEVY